MELQEPIQISYLINTLSVGGAEQGMARLLSGLPSDRFNITVIGLGARGDRIVDELPDHVRVVNLQIDSKRRIIRLLTLWDELEETDVLVTSLYHATQIGRLFGRAKNIPIILSWQHSERLESPIHQRLFGLLSVFDTAVLADSEAAATGAINSGVKTKKVLQVPIAGIDLDEYNPVLHKPKDQITVGTIGRLTPEKNIHAVLDVADNLQQKSIEFQIAGDGPEYISLKRRLKEDSIQNVTMNGFVENIPHFLRNLDIYFQPSIREGLCITVIEAMAAGLPIVASNVGGISESVVHGETGILTDPSSIGTFTKYIHGLSTKPNKRADYGTSGRSRVSKYYSQECLVNSFINVIDSV